MKKRICKNCVYFHPEVFKESFGGCGITSGWDKKNENDTCIDFSIEDKIYRVKEIIR